LGLLHSLFGDGVFKQKVETRKFERESKSAECLTLSSNYHIEITPSDAQLKDSLVIQVLLEEVAQSRPIGLGVPFTVIVLHNADKLSMQAQAALRRTMEKYAASCRMILVAKSLSGLIDPIRSRCVQLRFPAPLPADIQKVLHQTAGLEGFELPAGFAEKLAVHSRGDLRHALVSLQAAKAFEYPFKEDTVIHKLPWVLYIQKMVDDMVKSQTPATLLEIRNMIYDLLASCIPGDELMRELLKTILHHDQVARVLHLPIAQAAAQFTDTLQAGSKEAYHVEAFCASFMRVYKEHLVSA
jgi:replication factor C subunit 3/5